MLVLALAPVLACGDHLLDLDTSSLDEPDTFPVCMILSGTLGHWENGDSNIVWDLANEKAGAVCMCMTEEQYVSHELHGMLNDRMLPECERLSEQIGFDWDECEDDYSTGHWLGATYRCSPGEYWSFLVPEDLECE
jgi:hypothetical protein